MDYVTKPLQHEEVLARIELHLQLRNLTKTLQAQNQRLEREISERQQAEQKIHQQAALLDIATDAIIVHDWDNYISFWNQGAENLYGWSATEVIGENINQADLSTANLTATRKYPRQPSSRWLLVRGITASY